MQLFVHRMDQTAHISLQLPAISKSEETNETGCALTFSARPASSISVFYSASRCLGRNRWPVWRPVGASLRRR